MSWKVLGAWLLARLQEKSTWGALITAVATIVGATIAPQRADAIALVGTFIATGIAAATKEAAKEAAKDAAVVTQGQPK